MPGRNRAKRALVLGTVRAFPSEIVRNLPEKCCRLIHIMKRPPILLKYDGLRGGQINIAHQMLLILPTIHRYYSSKVSFRLNESVTITTVVEESIPYRIEQTFAIDMTIHKR